ncbi:TPA: hypothetical protein N8095_004045 [Escherichia coli]|nr:hypothetical protein [Escherichia coli]HBV0217071.1 hypothetical protein [Escherichia coli]HCO5126740.1 hypothetical protein [Escherichia coli]
MFNIEYKKISSLESIASDACSSIKPDEYKINLILAYEISTASLIENVLSDVHQLAEQWSADECPKNLYFNHGQYKVGGVDNIINELKEKPSSNRALYSLINQETIMNSGDDPIPSFMLFQCVLEHRVLYCNVYLRALEVSKFLRINLEEIRINIEKISNSSLSFDSVRLVIFACRAHHVPNFNPLEKPKLDLLSQYQMLTMLKHDRSELARALEQMAGVQTVIKSKSLCDLYEIVNGEWSESNKQLLLSLLGNTIEEIEELHAIRKQHSHHERVSALNSSISKKLNNIAREFK